MASRYFGSGEPAQPVRSGADGDAASPDQQRTSDAPAATSTASAGHLDREAWAQLLGGAGEPRMALLIGNDNYAHSKLANPVNDVRLIGETLRALGFEVTLLENADKPTLHNAIVDFGARLDAAGPEAVAMLYYAGHGIQHEGTNYLVPIKAEIPTSRHLAAGALKVDEIVAELSRAPRKANVIVLDACRVNPIPNMASSSRDVTQGLAALQLPSRGWLVAYSTSAGAVAADGDGFTSPYAEALVKMLPRLLQPGKRVHDVFVDTAQIVGLATGGKQEPALYMQGSLPALVVTEQDRERIKELMDAVVGESDGAKLKRILMRILAPRRRILRTAANASWLARLSWAGVRKLGPAVEQILKFVFITFLLWTWLKWLGVLK